jgi:hypothetical protein
MLEKYKGILIRNNNDHARLQKLEEIGVDIESAEFKAGYMYLQSLIRGAVSDVRVFKTTKQKVSVG